MNNRNRSLMAVLTIITAILLPATASAGQLSMKNGDVISGKVTKIEDGKVFVDPDYADEFSVDLAEVVSIQADQVFEVDLEDGSTVKAEFVEGGDGEQTLMVDGREMEVAMADLAGAAEPEPWYERTSHADVNMTWNSGNTDSRNNLVFLDTAIRTGDHRHLGELTIRRDETDGESTKKQDLFKYSYNWLFSGPWYLGATATYERDPIKDLDHRYMLGAIIGRDLIDDSNTFLTASLGVGYTEEKYAGVAESGATGLWNLRYEQDLGGGDFSFFHNHSLNYQFFADNNAILKTNTGFRYDILGDVYTTVSLRWDYETEPAPGTENEDSTLAIGIGAKF